MKAVLFGSSGLVGSHLLNYLIANEHIGEIVCFVRKKTETINHPKVSFKMVDFNSLKLYEDDFAADLVFCCLGTTIKKAGTQENFRKVDMDYPVEISRLAKSKDVKHLAVISSVGANSASANFYLRTKGEMEKSVRLAGIDRVSIMRPGLLIGSRMEMRRAEKLASLINPIINPLLFGKFKKYRSVKASEVAAAMFQTSLMDNPPELCHYNEIKELSHLLLKTSKQ